jgi:hypothetical protein
MSNIGILNSPRGGLGACGCSAGFISPTVYEPRTVLRRWPQFGK